MMDQNEERLAFYYEIGLAITQWAHVEFALAQIVSACFGKNDESLPATGFLSIDNFRSKLQYIDSIIAAHVRSKTKRADWITLMERAGALVKKRNRLAHSWVLNSFEEKAGQRVMLLPSRPRSSRRTKGARQKFPGAVCVRDVAQYRLEFSALMISLENFAFRLAGQKVHFPKSLEQPSRPPTIAQIRREIYEYAQRPPRPSRT